MGFLHAGLEAEAYDREYTNRELVARLGGYFRPWLGRFGVIVPVLAMAGSLAAKQRAAATDGTLPTHGPLFVALLIGTVLLVGLLNYVPALALGPVAEHLMLWAR